MEILSDTTNQVLFDKYHPIIRQIVKKMCFPRPADDDLLIIGELALWKSVEKYDHTSFNEKQFIAYARANILGACKHELRDYGKMIKIPAYINAANPDFHVVVESFDQSEELMDKLIGYDNNQCLPTDWIKQLLPTSHKPYIVWYIEHTVNDISIEDVSKCIGKSRRVVQRKFDQIKQILITSPQFAEWLGVE